MPLRTYFGGHKCTQRMKNCLNYHIRTARTQPSASEHLSPIFLDFAVWQNYRGMLSQGRNNMNDLDSMLTRNKDITAQRTAAGTLMPSLPEATPNIKAIILGCVDMRVDPCSHIWHSTGRGAHDTERRWSSYSGCAGGVGPTRENLTPRLPRKDCRRRR